MDETVRALTRLSALDDQLSGKEALMDDLALALQKRRAAVREAIPRVFLAAYDALGRSGRRPVVVAVRGGHCSGCYLRLPPQLDSTIRRRLSLCSCPHCGRLLYRPAPNESPSKRSPGTARKPRGRKEARASRRGRSNRS